jgi:dihydrofolate reductase
LRVAQPAKPLHQQSGELMVPEGIDRLQVGHDGVGGGRSRDADDDRQDQCTDEPPEPLLNLFHATGYCKDPAGPGAGEKFRQKLSIELLAVRLAHENGRRTDVGHILVFNHMTLDGVMQAPGRKDEDRRDGFTHGGWAQAGNDPVMGQVIGAGMARTTGLLFGRRTYEGLGAFWPHQPQPNPFTTILDNSRKFVVSRTLTGPLTWKNSTLLAGEAAQTVAALKAQPDQNLLVMGSSELVRTLLRHDLVDDFILMVHPIVLGSGRRLFGDDGDVARLRLADTKTTTTGVIIATYRAANREKAS